MNVFHIFFSASSRLGTSEWKETEWSRCQGKGEGTWGGGGWNMNRGKCMHAKGRKEKTHTHKDRNPNRLKSVRSLTLWSLHPDGGLCNATGVEPKACSQEEFCLTPLILQRMGQPWKLFKGLDELRCIHSSCWSHWEQDAVGVCWNVKWFLWGLL